MNNIWAKLHKLQDDEVEPNLKDYSVISTDENIVVALKEGLKEAQWIINSLNMAPNPQASTKNKVWFERRWFLELADLQSFAFAATKNPVQGEDGDMEVLREDLQQKEELR